MSLPGAEAQQTAGRVNGAALPLNRLQLSPKASGAEFWAWEKVGDLQPRFKKVSYRITLPVLFGSSRCVTVCHAACC